jgi:very-short-patch-repair endonuclease
MDSSHHDHPRARAADAERDRRLRGAGFAVERVRSRTLAERPDSLAAGLREQLARAGVA